jgi:hypothetical protein
MYDAILGYMPDCGKIPTNTERIDWFIPTVSEDIYASAKAMCLTQKIQGTLEWETCYYRQERNTHKTASTCKVRNVPFTLMAITPLPIARNFANSNSILRGKWEDGGGG